MKKMKIIFSGGGTGGHIYPAVAVAEELQKRIGKENVEILFVGALGKMEMTKVDELGFRIVGLPVSGLKRKLTLENFKVVWNSVKSIFLARKVIQNFKADIVVGFGGYASLPIVGAAQMMSVPTILWEGNSFAGLANRVLSKRAKKVVVSFDGMDKFFSKEKIEVLGNPVRGDFSQINKKSEESKEYFGFKVDRPTIVVTGGSLGARALNDAILRYFDEIVEKKEINLVWQCGAYYYKEMLQKIENKGAHENVWVSDFINKMKYAYEIADLVVARSGASTVTELALARCASVFVPSSNVTDDHQTKNAKSLVDLGAALMLKDDDTLKEKMIPFAVETVKNRVKIEQLESEITKVSKPSSAKAIVDLIIKSV